MPTPPTFTVGQYNTAAYMNAIGLWRVTNCTVSSTGGTAATASNGVITMGAGNTSVTVVNAFSADFDNYLVAVSAWGTIAGAALYAGVKTAAGVQNGANWKGNALYISTGTSGGFNNGFDNNTTSTAIGFLSVTNGAAYVFNINSPFLTQRTTINFNNADNDYWRVGASVLNDNVSYPSLIISPNAGTISGGTIRVYGYRL
jgi:hypothetical protein